MTVDVKRERVSMEQAAELVGVSRRTLYNWLEANKIEAVRTAGGALRIYVDTLFRNVDEPSPQAKKARRGNGTLF